ncbi:MAG TPA: helix-turn-helix domain-containing protein [Candidatus Tectomicrobia bacterium]
MTRQRKQLSETQFCKLKMAYTQSKKAETRTRYQAVRLYGMGYEASEISEITGCSYTSLLRWWREYRTDGVEALQDQRRGGNHARLSAAQLAEVRERLHRYSPAQLFGDQVASPDGQFWTLDDVCHGLQVWYGVTYGSLASYRNVLKRCGFSYQRTERIYRSRSELAVADFEAEIEKN